MRERKFTVISLLSTVRRFVLEYRDLFRRLRAQDLRGIIRRSQLPFLKNSLFISLFLRHGRSARERHCTLRLCGAGNCNFKASWKNNGGLQAAVSFHSCDAIQRGLVDASPRVFASFELGFCWLLFGLFWLLAGLFPMLFELEPVFEALPLPLTVTRSFTRRLPANELAIRCAVCFSFPV